MVEQREKIFSKGQTAFSLSAQIREMGAKRKRSFCKSEMN